MDNNTQKKLDSITKIMNEKKCVDECKKYKSNYETCILTTNMGVISSKCIHEERQIYKCLDIMSLLD